jgi:hypothetical protein
MYYKTRDRLIHRDIFKTETFVAENIDKAKRKFWMLFDKGSRELIACYPLEVERW